MHHDVEASLRGTKVLMRGAPPGACFGGVQRFDRRSMFTIFTHKPREDLKYRKRMLRRDGDARERKRERCCVWMHMRLDSDGTVNKC